MKTQEIHAVRKRVLSNRRMRERDQRVKSILEAGKKVFFSKGYLKATMDEIALEAEISKPTIYQYFKTKDDLYFSLMLPVVEDIGRQLAKVERKLQAGEYTAGDRLIHDLFMGYYHSYALAPDTFRIVQLFQQTGLVGELNRETRSALDQKGRSNFELGRQIVKTGILRGLIRKVNIYEFSDVIWGTFVGIVQLEDIKSKYKQGNPYLRPTLKLAENLIIKAMAVKREGKRKN